MAKLSLNMNGQANVFSARAAHLEEGPSCRRKEKKNHGDENTRNGSAAHAWFGAHIFISHYRALPTQTCMILLWRWHSDVFPQSGGLSVKDNFTCFMPDRRQEEAYIVLKD